ncbi:MAG: GNAT family N-acetyltransferase [bacterium]|nr:GNAT family N-acetyltransferase [bacterium]
MKFSFGECCIRSYEDGDVPSLARHANNRNIWITLADRFPHPYTEGDAKGWIEFVRSQEHETHFAIADDNEAFGTIGFSPGRDNCCKTAVMGYWLSEMYWGRGIMSKVVPAFTGYVFKNFPEIVRLQAEVFEGNPASGRVLEKAGFMQEARLRQSVFKDGKLMDDLIYAMLRGEWKEQHKR